MAQVLGVVLLFAASFAAAQSTNASLVEVPAELGPINWQLTPSAALATDSKGQGVVWLGAIEKVTAKPRGKELEIEWLCRHLQYAQPGRAAISNEPIAVVAGNTGHFVVNLILQAPNEVAETLRSQFAEAGRFLLASGFVEGVVTREGMEVVFLHTAKMVQADALVQSQKH